MLELEAFVSQALAIVEGEELYFVAYDNGSRKPPLAIGVAPDGSLLWSRDPYGYAMYYRYDGDYEFWQAAAALGIDEEDVFDENGEEIPEVADRIYAKIDDVLPGLVREWIEEEAYHIDYLNCILGMEQDGVEFD